MFFGPNATATIGCVLLVDQITSRVNPQAKHFAGVLLGIKKSGVTSHIVLRSLVMDVGVEMSIPIYSPMITQFTVLKEAPKDIKGSSACYWTRNKYAKSGLDYQEIEAMVVKHKNQLVRAKQVLSEKALKVKGASGASFARPTTGSAAKVKK